MNLEAARAIADREFVQRSLDSTRSIFAKYKSDLDVAVREPCYVATAGKPNWHRFYFPIKEGEIYLLIVVNGSDPPTLLRSSIHIQRRVMVFIWSDSLTSHEIATRAQLDEPECRSGCCSDAPSHWSIDSEDLGPDEPSELVASLLDQIDASRQAISQLLASGDAKGCLNISLPYIANANLGLLLVPEALQRIASFGLTLTFNTWQRPLELRDVEDDDLPVFFQQQLDRTANHMAAFTSKDPADRDAFDKHWSKIRGDETVAIRTIVVDDHVVGSVLSYQQDGRTEVSYWIGREYWGRGIATRALQAFLDEHPERPVYARAAQDNVASIRVLEKCGFQVCGHDRGFANARDEEIDEIVMVL